MTGMDTGATIDPAAVLAAAERLARAGWPVFPCVPGEKRPLTPHGMLDATTDLEQIRRWWRRTPTANLAIPTGTATVDVLDVDVRPTGSGFAAFNDLKRAGLLTGYSRVVSTPTGGMHVYFTGTDQPSSRLPDHHLDLKAAGGYVLVPPSVVAGGRYTVVRRTTGQHQALDWIVVRARLARDVPAPPSPRHRPTNSKANSPQELDVLAAWVATLPEGQRNSGTFWAACRAAEHGHADLTPLVEAAVRTGLPEVEARRTVTSAVRRVTSTSATGSTNSSTTTGSSMTGRARGTA